MAGNALYDVGMRLRAAELYDEGHGRASIAALLGVPEETVRKWLEVYRSVGIEVLAMTGTKKAAYPFETKVAAVRAVVDEGMTKPEAMAQFGITSSSALKKWLRAYREGGPEALRPKPKGRPRGARSAPKEPTREQELERRVQRLEAENAYLKKSIALKAEKRSRTARGRSS
jgi:transposase